MLKGAAHADAGPAIAQESGFANTAKDIQSMQSGNLQLWEEKLEGTACGILCLNMHFDLCVWAHDRSSSFIELKLTNALELLEIPVFLCLNHPNGLFNSASNAWR